MRWIVSLFLGLLIVVAGSSTAVAQSADLDAIGSEIDRSGRYLDFSSDGGLDQAIDNANDQRVAFAWIAGDDDAENVALDLLPRLGSSYDTVLVLSNTGVGAWSDTIPDGEILDAIDAGLPDFRNDNIADGIDAFLLSLGLRGSTQTSNDQTSGGTTATTAAENSTESSSSSGGGIRLAPILLIGLIGGGGFLLFRSFRSKSRAKKQAAIDLEIDRDEITEQLHDNADHVLTLGDRVIASGKPHLIATYEEASATYQDVSQSIDGATTAEEVDALDDRIDRAEWQFESIEAELDGRPAPPSPEMIEAQAKATEAGPTPPAPSSDGPALGPDDSVLGGSPPRPRQQPRSRRQAPGRRGRNSGGLGGGLGSILGSIVLGGGLGGLGGSRRTQRRRSTSGGVLGGSNSRTTRNRRSTRSTRSTSMGGGVLRRGGSSRRGGGGGRSFGKRGGGGGRRF